MGSHIGNPLRQRILLSFVNPHRHPPCFDVASPHFLPVIGLVGGVGSGKSSIANHLSSRRSIVVLDGDAVGHRVLEEVGIKDQIRQVFGDLVLNHCGEIDRSRLGSRVFGDSPQQQQARKELETLVHPRIRAVLSEQIDRVRQLGTDEAIFLDAAVLFEAGWNELCDSIVFVDTPLSTRRQRVADSRGWSEETLSKRESSQWPLERKRQHANWTIDNSNSLDDAAGQLEQILNAIHKQDS